MTKYIVEYAYTVTVSIPVEAEDEEEAKEIAAEKFDKDPLLYPEAHTYYGTQVYRKEESE